MGRLFLLIYTFKFRKLTIYLTFNPFIRLNKNYFLLEKTKNQPVLDKSDKEIIIRIVAKAFSESHRLLAIMKKGKKEKRLRIMANYAYHLVKKFDGIYLSEDKSTVLFYYRKKQYRQSFSDYLRYFRMFLLCIRPEKAFSTMKRENYIKSLRPTIPDYIYVWVLGSDPEKQGLKGLADIRDHLFEVSEKQDLPILIETTVEKVLKLYHYVGFEIYREIFDDTIDMPVWFLKRGDIINGKANEKEKEKPIA